MSAIDTGTAGSSSAAGLSAFAARHKYANLPDVDITAPDVYETPSLPKVRRRRTKPAKGKGGGNNDGQARKTSGTAAADQHRDGVENASDGPDDPDADYSFESEDPDSVESSDDDSPYKIRKVPRGWTRAAPRPEIVSNEIERTSLSQFEAEKKFRNAVELDTSSADFSGSLRRNRKRNGAAARRGRDAGMATSTYQLGQEREDDESLVDRLRRLKFEAGLLEEEIAKSAEGIATDQTGDSTEAAVAETAPAAGPTGTFAGHDVPISEMLSQLAILRRQLAQLDSSDPSGTEVLLARDREAWETQTKSLLQRLANPAAASSNASSLEGAEAGSDQHISHSSKANGSTLADVGVFDRRLAELEEALGINETMLDENKAMPKPVLPALIRLEQQLQLLSQPRHLDAISRRVKVLVTELDRVQDSRQKLLSGGDNGGGSSSIELPSIAGGTDAKGESVASSSNKAGFTPDELARLNHLFTVSSRLDPLLPLVPSIVSRMQTLSDVHASSVHFARTLEQLEARKQSREREDQEAAELMSRLEKSLDENGEVMRANLISLDERIASLATRIDRLAS